MPVSDRWRAGGLALLRGKEWGCEWHQHPAEGPASSGQDLQYGCMEGRTCSIREYVPRAGERPKRDMGRFRATVLTVAVPDRKSVV